jgi:hypothetical protein
VTRTVKLGFKMSLRRGFDFVVNDERPRGQWKQTGVAIAGGRDQRAAEGDRPNCMVSG